MQLPILLACACLACSGAQSTIAPPPAPAPPCEAIAIAVDTPRDPPTELVVAINGDECHREPLFAGGSPFAARLGNLCMRDIEPGTNDVVVQVVHRHSCAAPLVEARRICFGLLPD